MKTGSRRKFLLPVMVLAMIAAVFAVVAIGLGSTRQKQSDMNADGAVISLTQNGDTIVFNADGTYAIQGDIEIKGITFTYDTAGTYSVTDGMLVFNEESPDVHVDSQFGNFDMSGHITAEIKDGALIVRLEASNDQDTYELAVFTLGKKEADALGVAGVTADSWSDDGSASQEDKSADSKSEATLDADGALLTVESGGNKIAFFPDGTFKVLAHLTQSVNGMSVTFDYQLEGTYQVQDGKLILPDSATGILNSDLFASYGYTDVPAPTRCSAQINDGLLELHFVIEASDGDVEIAVFKIGQSDAEKIGVTGVTGDTVIEAEPAVMPAGAASAPASSDNAPYQPVVASGARPLSFSNGGYTITFYSNGQYQESGTVFANGVPIDVRVTDTYSIDSGGRLSLNTGNQVACYFSYQGYSASFGALNNTSCSGSASGCTVSFRVNADGKFYDAGTVMLSAEDIRSIEANYGLSGENAAPAPAPTPAPAPEPKPDPAPNPGEQDSRTVRLVSDSGLELIFHTDSKTFDVAGKTSAQGIDLLSYSLAEPGAYTTDGNELTIEPANLKIVALNDLAKKMEGTYPLSFTVTKGASDTLTIALSVGEPPISFELTGAQAEQMGIDIATYAQDSGTDEPAAPDSSYTPDESKSVIAFDKDQGTFDISGAGTLKASGMDAGLSFALHDSFSADADGTVTAANTADALSYTLTMMGQSAEGTATPQTSIVKNGDVYKVTLSAEVGGREITLCEGEVPAADVAAPAQPDAPGKMISYTVAKQDIAFDSEGGTFTASGDGSMDAMGTSIPITFSITDRYSVSEDGSVRAADTAGALTYTAMGYPGTADPVVTITKTASGYNVKIEAAIQGQRITLLDRDVARDKVVSPKPATSAEGEGAGKGTQSGTVPAEATLDRSPDKAVPKA